ncbi:MAG: phasin family protein [Alphaproteobacteria bacterium]|jgi:phasin family protein|nr:phasin family protein [Alphaproteobacteria bacterium]
MTAANPFAGFDFSKYMGDFKLPAFDVEKAIAVQTKNVETLTNANKLAAESVQAIFQRQTAIARESAEEMTAAFQEMMAAGEPKDKLARQSELAREGFERGVANFKELAAAATKTNQQVFDILNKRFVESLSEVQGFAKPAKK